MRIIILLFHIEFSRSSRFVKKFVFSFPHENRNIVKKDVYWRWHVRMSNHPDSLECGKISLWFLYYIRNSKKKHVSIEINWKKFEHVHRHPRASTDNLKVRWNERKLYPRLFHSVRHIFKKKWIIIGWSEIIC